MQPDEERLVGSPLTHPGAERGSHRPGVALGFDVLEQFDVGAHPIVVEVESLGEPEPVVQDEGADERGGGIAVLLQDFRQRLVILGEAIPAIDSNSVSGRIGPRQNGGVRGKGKGNRGSRSPEGDPSLREAIEVSGLHLAGAAVAHVVAPKGVDGDEDHVAGADRPG